MRTPTGIRELPYIDPVYAKAACFVVPDQKLASNPFQPLALSEPDSLLGDDELAITTSIVGLTIANDTTDPANDIQIAAGSCVVKNASGDYKVAQLASSLIKQLDATWAAGNNAGLRSSTARPANSLVEWHLFLIYNPTTSTADILAHNSLDPSGDGELPSGYSHWRYLWSIKDNGQSTPAIRKFKQVGHWLSWMEKEYPDVTVSANSAQTDYTVDGFSDLDCMAQIVMYPGRPSPGKKVGMVIGPPSENLVQPGDYRKADVHAFYEAGNYLYETQGIKLAFTEGSQISTMLTASSGFIQNASLTCVTLSLSPYRNNIF